MQRLIHTFRRLLPWPKAYHWPKVAMVAATIVLALTPYYAVAMLIVVALAAHWRPRGSQFFDSYVIRFITNCLLFGAVVMAVGMYCWLLDVAMHPILPLGIYALIALLAYAFVPRETSRDRFFTFADGLSAIAAGVGLMVLIGSFYLPQPSTSASAQLITNGFDNGAHLSLIQTTYENNGYVYGSYDDIKDAIAWKTLTAYPQGWHLANAVQWRGMGLDVFSTTDRSLALNIYAATMLVWQFVAIFLFGRVALYITMLLGAKRWRSPGLIVGFFTANLLIQAVVFWGSLNFGFATFIGAICYFTLLVACLLETQTLKQKSASLHWVVAGLSTVAIGLSWLFPVFAALGMVGVMLLAAIKKRGWRLMMAARKQAALYAAITTALLVPVVSIVVIGRVFTVQPDQINDHGGIFGLSNILVGAIVLFCLYSFMRTKSLLQVAFLAMVTPQLVFVGVIYAYQFATIGHTEYFFTKSVALLLCIVGVFFVAAFIKLLSTLSLKSLPVLSTLAIAAILVTSAVVISGQDPSYFNALRQQKSQVQPATARVYAKLAQQGELMKRHVITFTKLDYGGDVNANVLSNALNPPTSTCLFDVYWLIYSHRGKEFPGWVNRCATAKDNITVITSSETHKLIRDLNNPVIRTVLAE